jgi:hypothetical protein
MSPSVGCISGENVNTRHRSDNAYRHARTLHWSPCRVAAAGLSGRWAGRWRGTYVCPQWLTGVLLNTERSEAGDVSAVFSFFAMPENARVPLGGRDMAGRPGPQAGYFAVEIAGRPPKPGSRAHLAQFAVCSVRASPSAGAGLVTSVGLRPPCVTSPGASRVAF